MVQRWGSLDIWVNNAARIFVKRFLEISTEEWHGLLAANLHGYFFGCKAAAARMAAQDGPGRIINITSQSDVQAINGFSAYVTAKGGILGLTRVLALELAEHDITVNAVSPGPTDTPLNKTAWTPKARATYIERIGLHRIATPEETADVVCFVASARVALHHRTGDHHRRRPVDQRQRRPRRDQRRGRGARTQA